MELIEDFQGRILKVIEAFNPDPQRIKHHFPDRKVNVLEAEYPLSVDEIKKKYKLINGDQNLSLIFTTLMMAQSKQWLVAESNKILFDVSLEDPQQKQWVDSRLFFIIMNYELYSAIFFNIN